MKNKKVVIALIVALVIGFAGVSTTLLISGALKIGFNADDFGVIFTEAVINGEKSSAVISENKKEITFSSSKLSTLDESSILNYKVKNKSTQYNAEATINCTTEETEYVSVVNELGEDIIGENYKTVLLAQEERSGVITAKLVKPYVGEDTSITVKCVIDVKPTIEETTKQTSDTTTTTQTDDETKYNLTIDPDGGLYNGSTDTINTKVAENTEVTLDEVTKEGYIFSHWLVNDENLTGNKVTITKDTTIKAVWISVGDVVARIDNNYYSTVQSAFDAAKANDEVVLLKDTEEVATNSKNVYLNLDSHKITGKIINTGQIKIDNGTIENLDGSAVVNNGSLTLGEPDKEVSITVPSISGTNKGIEQNGTFNFYDGVIEGIVGVAGDYTETEENHHAFVDHNDVRDCQKIYLEADNGRGVVKTTTNGNVYYLNLQDAINTSSITSYPIYAIRDFEAPYSLSVPTGANISFDIEGYTVEAGNTFTNNGTLTLQDSTKKTGALQLSVELVSNGTLNINDLVMSQTTDADLITSNNSLNISNSTLTSKTGKTVSLINTSSFSMDENTKLNSQKYSLYLSKSTVTMDSGYINSAYVSSGSNFIINGGHVDYNTDALSIQNEGVVNINDGFIRGSVETKYSATLVISGGQLKYKVLMNKGKFEMNGGEINNSINLSATNYKISGGIIKPSGSAYAMTFSNCTGTIENVNIYGNGLYLKGGNSTIENINFSEIGDEVGVKVDFSATLTMNGGTIKGPNGISIQTGNVYVNGGEIIGLGYSNGIYGAGDGIDIGNSNSTLTIGNDDDNFDSSPIVIGKNYGVWGCGRFYYYDGILKGGVEAVLETSFHTFSIPSSYKIKKTTEEIQGTSYNVYTLEKELDFLKVNDQTFDNLNDAVDAIESEGIIELLRDGIMSAKLTIPENKTITLDLKGKTLTSNESIINLGSLKVMDSSEEKTGLLKAINSARLFGNQKNLLIEGIKIENHANQYVIYSNVKDSSITIIDTEITHDTNSYEALAVSGGMFTMRGSSVVNTQPNNIISRLISITSAYDIDDVYINFKRSNATKNTYAMYLVATGTIKNSTIVSQTDGINASNLTIENTTVESGKTGITGSGSITINNCDITGITGIYLYNTSAFYVNSGTITGSEYGIQLSCDRRNINIGSADNDNLNSPIIIGDKYGIYDINAASTKSAFIKYYNGFIKGIEGAINCGYFSIRDGYFVNDTNEIIDEKTYKVNSLEKQANFLRVGENRYNSLLEAIESIETEGTIYLETSGLNTYDITIPNNKSITIDLNGNTLTTMKKIDIKGTLEINDTSTSKSGMLKTINNVEMLFNISSGGNLSLKNIVLENNSSCSNVITSDGSLELYKVNFYSNTMSTLIKSVSSSNSKSFKMTDGEIRSSANAIIAIDGTSITISGTKMVQENASNTGKNTSFSFKGNGSIKNINVISIDNAMNAFGELTIDNASITSDGTALAVSGTINLDNLNIHGQIGLTTSGTVHLNSGTLYGSQYGLYNYGDLQINKATITGLQYGLNNSGTLNIGTDGGNVQREIFIKGDLYGIYRSNGQVNFYDGVIAGVTEPIYGGYDGIATNKSINEIEEEIGGNTYIVNSLKPVEAIFKIGQNVYTDFNTAIDESTSGDIIEVLESTQIFEGVTIPENKNVVIDMNGEKISFIDVFTNNGEVSFINSSDKQSTIKMLRAKNLFENNGILNISKTELINNTSNYIVKNSLNARTVINDSELSGLKPLVNEGYLEINDSQVISNDDKHLDNKGDAKLNNSIFSDEKTYKNAINNVGNLTIVGGSYGYIRQIEATTSTSSITDANVYNIQVNKGTSSLDRSTLNFATFNIPEITISNCNFVSITDDVLTIGSSTVATLNNNSFDLRADKDYSYDAFINNSGTLNLTDTTISLVDDRPGYSGYYYDDCSAIVNKGNLTVDNLNINISVLREELRNIVKNRTSLLQRNVNNVRGILNLSNGYAKLNNVTIKATDCYEVEGISVSGGTVEIPYSNKPINIELNGMEGAGYVFGAYVGGGTLVIGSDYADSDTKPITIEASVAKTNVGNIYGVYVNGGTFTMGVKDETETSGTENASVGTTNPVIKGISSSTIGVGVKKDNGSFNFYDGKVIGSYSAIPDTITSSELYYEAMSHYDENNYEYKILEYMG